MNFIRFAFANHYQQADTGTKMIHIGQHTKSTIIAKGISAGQGQNAYRGLVRVAPTAHHAQNYTQCDSLLLGDRCGRPIPSRTLKSKMPARRWNMKRRHQKISEDQLFYCLQRGLTMDDAITLIVNGFCKQSIEINCRWSLRLKAQKLLGICLEGSVG